MIKSRQANLEVIVLLNQSDLLPSSEPALELLSRAASSVGVMYPSSNPNTGSNSRGGKILKKHKKTDNKEKKKTKVRKKKELERT